MKAYLCQTPDGPQYQHLQVEAKRLDPNYETVEIDTTKGPLLDQLNDLMRRAHATQPAAPAEAEEEGGIKTALVTPPPPKPVVKVAMPPHAARNDAQIAWEEFIWSIPANEAYRIDVLQKALTERSNEIKEQLV